MLKIEVTSTVKVKNVVKKATGESFSIPEQECWAHIPGEAHPTKVIRAVGRDQQPLAAGMYMLDGSSFYVDRYSNLAIRGQFAVTPIASAAQGPAPLAVKRA